MWSNEKLIDKIGVYAILKPGYDEKDTNALPETMPLGHICL